MENKKTFVYEDKEYRIKQMNAIELMALRSQIDFDDYNNVVRMYETLLEKIEVNVNDRWLPVKTPNSNIYVPSGIENNLEVVEQLITNIMSYLKSVFMKSNASKKEQE